MTEYEKLKRYNATKAVIKVLEQELEEAYKPISSPTGKEVIGGKSSVRVAGNPTEQALNNVNRIKAKIQENQRLIDDVDRFIDNLDEPLIQTMCHLHYRKGYSWNNTALRLYGNYTGDTVRMAIKRYFKRGVNND